MNVLIVEGEKALQHDLEKLLSSESWHCDIANGIQTASEKIFVNSYDMVLLDRDLPDVDGLQLLSEVSTMSLLPAVIIISAIALSSDKVKALNMGADDYLTKPFNMPELMARMKAVLRRKFGYVKNLLLFYGFPLDIENKTLLHNDEPVNLTRKEYDVLEYLVLNRNRAVPRDKLSEHVWGSEHDSGHSSNYVEVHVKNLRQKLARHTDTSWFQTIRGFGYKMNIPEKA